MSDTINKDSFAPLTTAKQQSLNEEYRGPTRNKVPNKRPHSTSSESSSQLTGPTIMEKIVTPTTMDASSHSNMGHISHHKASPFVAPTKRSIIPLKKQKEEGIKADQTDHKSIDLALEPLKHFFAKIPDIYIMNFVQYRDLLTKAKGNPDIVELT